jgi:TolA-binding protein
MGKYRRLVAAVALVAGSGFGCANITVLRVAELKAVEEHVDTLKAQVMEAQEKATKQQTELLRVIRADMQVRFGELSQRIAAIEGGVNESQARLQDIDKKTGDLRLRLDEKARADSLKQALQKAEEENLFQIAYGDFSAGRYDLALGGFKDLIVRFPSSSQAEAAGYWSAECAYAQKDYDNAEVGYTAYLKNYQNGSKVCATLYKLGLVYDKKQKKQHQKLVWDKLQAQCPKSDEAQAAAAAGSAKTP